MITRRLISRPLGALSKRNWVCPTCAQSSLPQQYLSTTSSTTSRRTLATATKPRAPGLPALGDYDTYYRQNGVPGLFTPVGMNIGWYQYQGMILSRLRSLCAGEPAEQLLSNPKALAIQYARDPMNASLFNHASMAFNNHFFYDGLSTKPIPLEDPKLSDLHDALAQQFGSIETLRTTFLDTAASMFGPGFVWLVWVRNTAATVAQGEFRILSTYLAGTPFPEAGFRRQPLDMNTTNRETWDAYHGAPTNDVGAFGAYSGPGKENSAIPPGGKSLMPVLCVNTWEHVYIYDYGLLAKRKFLADWWDAVDWEHVYNNVPQEAWNTYLGPRSSGTSRLGAGAFGGRR